MTERRIVLDASAVVAWARAEQGADIVGKLLPVAVIPAPNLAEALYIIRRHGHGMSRAELHLHILGMGALIEPFTEPDALRAAELIDLSRANPASGGRTLSLGDAQCVAVAERLGLPVCGDDRAWDAWPVRVPFRRFR
ncbi:PIN domain nuclease [Carbonactinospora thermoautotrophica]|uniref:PIN domain-containing protein n=1 Tax=Carbonactinospora thermoautotrophica TaxID=1469144 RepID=UPI00226E3471|nr:PIN domain-containing protein [Carbonactinospora thermoautotrophica]MCX9191621.1 PIN domain nuclease [Carbonactinospora thermoautotrophica]